MSERLEQVESAQVVDMRNPKNLEKYPFLVPIREAAICISDFLIEERCNSFGKTTLRDLPLFELNSFTRTLNLGNYIENEAEMEQVYWLHKAFNGRCMTTSRGISLFLKEKYPGKFDAKILHTHSNLKYFSLHEILILTENLSGIKIGISLGNLINQVYDSQDISRGRFSFPKYKGKPFQRSTNALISECEENVLSIFSEVEGINGPLNWDDYSSYTDEEIEYEVPEMTRFIRNWKGVDSLD